MRKIVFLQISLSLAVFNLTAQDFILTFSSVTPENNIDSIRAINAETRKTVFVKGSNTINMSSFTTGTNLLPTYLEQIDVYPNPFVNKTELRFYSGQTTQIKISLTDIDGRTISEKRQNITRGLHRFTISVKNEGLYILNVTGNKNKFSQKIISVKNNSTLSKIEYNGYSSIAKREKSAKIDNNDLIFFYVYSGDNITKIADSPTESKTYEVEFYECKDADGNLYPVVKIGSQWWMAENLKTIRYKNGDSIPNVTDGEAWSILKTGAYCSYNNDEDFADTYGRLYNWYTVDDSRKVAPEGWHVPSDEEWTILTSSLGGELVAGGKLKAAGNAYWLNPNTAATDSIGFHGLPGGLRTGGGTINPTSGGNFKGEGEEGHWHSSTEYNDFWIHRRYLMYNNSQVGKWDPHPKGYGFSIRCVKD
ncbi:FISUMP domain-containing protein [Maribellus maritimus]|uniref:FISUMP domain-containing protein n=1 Tax=Maribellus maritimus TaxID=2870838 RepID=UPI001EEB57BA|nr:FISUMP domain-containing protein [Maribellus maritimus]MCG6190513.1 T9SS type A sorting domain-containing protein [Maribellus maritimus]